MGGRRTAANAVIALCLGGTVSAAIFGASVADTGFALVFLAYGAVGWLVARRRPDNPIGWLALTFGALGSAVGLMWAWVAAATAWGWPGAAVADWLQSWMWAPVVGIITGPLLVLFPDGRLLSPRWRIVIWLSGAFVVLAAVGNALAPLPVDQGGPNPYAVPRAEHVLKVARDLAGIALIASLLGGVAALVIRYRRAGPVQRRQLKWFLAAAAVFPVALTVGEMANQRLQPVAVPTAFVLIAVAIGIAILRHGLYDIDRIISRTVAYGLVSTIVVGVYFAVVTALTALTSPVTSRSPLAVAAATLLAASVFQPLRRRIQHAVDRRFNRARYDAARAVESYRGRLRDELDLDAIAAGLVDATRSTLEPAATAVWFQPRGGTR